MTRIPDEFAVECFDEKAIERRLDAAVKRLLCECFPADREAFSRSRWWHGSAPEYTLISREGAEVTGHVGVVVRTVSVGDREVEVAGVQSLALAPELRGSGLGRALMVEAMERARRKGIELGLLFCMRELEPFYAGLGWSRVEAPVTMEYPPGTRGPMPSKNIAMSKPLGDAPFPAGPLDLNGPDW